MNALNPRHAMGALRAIAHELGVDGPQEIESGMNERIAKLCISQIRDLARSLDREGIDAKMKVAVPYAYDVTTMPDAAYWQEMYRKRANAANEQVKRRDADIDVLGSRVDELVAENAALIKRRDELLALVQRIAQATPLPDEIEGWEGQRARLIAEVGTLRSVIRDLTTKDRP